MGFESVASRCQSQSVIFPGLGSAFLTKQRSEGCRTLPAIAAVCTVTGDTDWAWLCHGALCSITSFSWTSLIPEYSSTVLFSCWIIWEQEWCSFFLCFLSSLRISHIIFWSYSYTPPKSSSQILPPLPTHPTSCSVSSITKSTHIQKTKQKQKPVSVLCWPATPGREVFTGVWLIYAVLLHWRKPVFPLPATSNCE